MRSNTDVLDTLPVLQRFALAYAPVSARSATLGLFALDTKLAGIVRSSSEQLLGQLRIAWWRERLESDPASWPRGEPVFAALSDWQEFRHALLVLVDGWEEMTRESPLPDAALQSLAAGRAECFSTLARIVGADGVSDHARRLALEWAIADIASKVSHPAEHEAGQRMLADCDWGRARLGRAMRPLAILHGLARRSVRRGKAIDQLSPRDVIPAIRLGLLGR